MRLAARRTGSGRALRSPRGPVRDTRAQPEEILPAAPHTNAKRRRGDRQRISLALRVMSAGIGIIWSRSVRSLIFVIQVDRDGEPALSGPIGCVIAMMREVAAGFPAVAGREVPTRIPDAARAMMNALT